MDKKELEENVARFFIEKLNTKYSFDYLVELNNDESKGDQDVDVYAISSTSRCEKLNLQLTTCDEDVLRKVAYMNKEIKKGNNLAILANLTPKEIIVNAQKKKELHTEKENIILLIHSLYSAEINKQYAKKEFPKLAISNYKSIFFVRTPSESHSGQIIAIRNCFGEDGVSF